MVAVNDRNIPVGEDHPRAVLTNHEVELMRKLREVDGFSYTRLADIFGVSIETVGRICRYERRAQAQAATRPAWSRELIRKLRASKLTWVQIGKRLGLSEASVRAIAEQPAHTLACP